MTLREQLEGLVLDLDVPPAKKEIIGARFDFLKSRKRTPRLIRLGQIKRAGSLLHRVTVLIIMRDLSTATKLASTSCSSDTRTSKNPTTFPIFILAPEIVEDLEAALEQFREIAGDLRANSVSEQDP